MLVVLLFKTTSTASYAVHLWFISKLGQTLTVVGWDVVYYLFSFLNGGVMFVLILLIGSGWSYLKPKLNDRENYMLTIVIILQIVANVARIFVGESSPGSEDFLTWKDILAVVDIVCCALVLFPIIWSIHKLKGTLAAVESEERGSALDADTTEAGKSKVFIVDI
jgi:prepilin signal peptidase PulO-like enzyme (type II secretory pathway)